MWKQRYRITRFWGLQIAQSAISRGALVSNQTGDNWIVLWDLISGQILPLKKQTPSMAFFTLSPDGQYIYYLKDDSGNDLGHIVRLSVMGAEEDLTPDLPPYSAFYVFLSQSSNALGFTMVSRNGYQTYVLPIDNHGNIGHRRMIHSSHSLTAGPWLSYDGKLALVASNKFSGDLNFGLIVIDTDNGNPIVELWDGPGSSLWLPIRNPFSPALGKYDLLIQTTKTGFARPGIYNPLTEVRVDLTVDMLFGNISPICWSSDGMQILLRQDKQTTSAYFLYDLIEHRVNPLHLPQGIYSDLQFLENKLFAVWENPTHASQIVEVNSKTGNVQPVLYSKDTSVGRDWTSVTFCSTDGLEIQTWLALPEGEGPHPIILNIPGGRTKNGYHPESQMWLDHGFAYISVNHRGFRSDLAHHGEVRSLDDILSARNWLLKHDIAHPHRIFLTGGSEGGYLTLLALGLYPDYWAGGLVWGPITDWKALYEDAGESRELAVAYLRCTPEENPDIYAKCSPITYVDNVKAPVQIHIGCNDNHVTTRQVKEYQQCLNALGNQVEVIWYEGGHEEPDGSVMKQIEYQERRLEFVYRVLASLR